MEHIVSYLNRLFEKLPQTPQLAQEKERMLQAAQKEYMQLREQGMNEAQAVSRIIGGFRNIDDLAQQYAADGAAPAHDPSLPVVDEDYAKRHIKAWTNAALKKAFGVALLISCPALEMLEDYTDFGAGFFLMLAAIAAGVTLIVLGGNEKKRLRLFDRGCYLTPSGQDELARFSAEESGNSKATVIGILLCVFSVFTPSIFFAWDVGGAAAALFLSAAAGVFALVYRGQIKKLLRDSSRLLCVALRRNETRA